MEGSVGLKGPVDGRIRWVEGSGGWKGLVGEGSSGLKDLVDERVWWVERSGGWKGLVG